VRHIDFVKYNMKNETILPTIFVVAFSFLASCNTNITADQYLQDNYHRKDIVVTTARHQTYMAEMTQEIANNDSCKQMMTDHMMSRCKEGSTMCKMRIGKTMEMCELDR